MDNRIYRSRDTKMIAGVCGGIAEMFNLDPTLVRLVTVALVIFSGFTFLLIYVMCAIIIPLEPSSGYILQQHNRPTEPEQRAYQPTTAPAAGTAEESVKAEEAAPVPAASPEGEEDSVMPEEPADYVAAPVEQNDSEEEEGKF